MPPRRSAYREVPHESPYVTASRAASQAYSAQQYENALELLSTALFKWRPEWRSSERLALLDLKCACQVKLSGLEDAIDTAKLMIRLDKTNGLGYSRMMSIEKQRGNFVTALRYLEHARSRVPTTDKLLKRLIAQQKNLQRLADDALVMSNATDPMQVLPLELLQLVLSLLDFQQIVSMIRVSKSWKKVLSSLEPITTTVNFCRSYKKITRLELNTALRRSSMPKVLAINRLSASAAQLLVQRLSKERTWNNLEHLVLHAGSFVEARHVPFQYCRSGLKSIFFGYGIDLSIQQVFNLLRAIPTLKEAVFRCTRGHVVTTQDPARNESLETLKIAFVTNPTPLVFRSNDFSGLVNLRKLIINSAHIDDHLDLRNNTQLVELDTTACSMSPICLPASLEQWTWGPTDVSLLRTASAVQLNLMSLPRLRSISLSSPGIHEILSFLHASKIVLPGQILQASLNYQNADHVMMTSSSHGNLLNKVEDLSVISDTLTDEHLPEFINTYPELQTLCLHAGRITGIFISDLLRRPGNRIQRLILKECRKIPPDTIDWARAQGVQVEITYQIMSKFPPNDFEETCASQFRPVQSDPRK